MEALRTTEAEAHSDCTELREALEEAEDEIEMADEDLIRVTEDFLEKKHEVEGLQADVDELIELKDTQQAAIHDLQRANEKLSEECDEQFQELEFLDESVR
eukprot:7371277-Prymnesium_polylepis.1